MKQFHMKRSVILAKYALLLFLVSIDGNKAIITQKMVYCEKGNNMNNSCPNSGVPDVFCMNHGSEICPYITVNPYHTDLSINDLNIYGTMTNISIYAQNRAQLNLMCDENINTCSYLILNTSNVNSIRINGSHKNLTVFTQNTHRLFMRCPPNNPCQNTNIYYNNHQSSLYLNHTFSVILYNDSNGKDKGYILMYDKYEWLNGALFCQQHFAAPLATISSYNDAQVLFDLYNIEINGAFWIGLTDTARHDSWMFLNGYHCDGNCKDDVYWHPTEPADSWNHCGLLRLYSDRSIDNMMASDHCNTRKQIICNAPDARSSIVYCDKVAFCDKEINIASNQELVLMCVDENACFDFIINGMNATKISIWCTVNKACSNMVINIINTAVIEIYASNEALIDSPIIIQRANTIIIGVNDNMLMVNGSNTIDINMYISDVGDIINALIDAPNANELKLYCQTDRACTDIVINGSNINNIDITCINYNACSYIIMYGENAKIIQIHASYYNALSNSTIYAVNANKVNIFCLKSCFYLETCVNLHIYLSSELYSNTINCDSSGCNGVNMYFKNNNINLSVFDNIILNGCKSCQDQRVCIGWNVYYNNDSLINFSRLLPSYYNDSGIIIDNTHECNLNLLNETISIFSIIIGTMSSTTLVLMLIIISIKVCITTYRKISNEYVSSRPALYILLCSICADILISISILWWTIKTILFYVVMSYYCKHHCIYDAFCDANTTYSDANESISIGILMVLSIILIIWWIIQIIATLCCYNIHEPATSCCLPIDCCMIAAYNKLRKEEEIFNKIYRTRQFWTEINWKLCHYLVQFIIRYIIMIIVPLINMILYGNENTDYSIKWYTMYPILMLLIFKVILQISYTFGPKYNIAHEIDQLLTIHFGANIGMIIKIYLPLFHDQSLCSSSTIITKQKMQKFQKTTQLTTFEIQQYSDDEHSDDEDIASTQKMI